MKIDITKKYKTSHGRDVEIIAIREDILIPVIGIISEKSYKRLFNWNLDGSADSAAGSVFDLVEVNNGK